MTQRGRMTPAEAELERVIARINRSVSRACAASDVRAARGGATNRRTLSRLPTQAEAMTMAGPQGRPPRRRPPTSPWPRLLHQARGFLLWASSSLTQGDQAGFEEALRAAAAALTRAEQELRRRIVPGPRLVGVVGNILSAQQRIRSARTNRADPRRAADDLQRARAAIEAARTEVGLQLAQ